MRKEDVDNIADILHEEKWNGKSVKELKEYCKKWDKIEKYNMDLREIKDAQLERILKRYKYLYDKM